MKRILVSETPNKIGEKVKVAGWVQTRRDHGKLIFIDLRDRSGLLQVVFGEKASELRPEWVIEIEGKVVKRPENMVNTELATGTVELKAEKLTVLSESKTPPFPLDTDGYDISEELRLKYRYLDLRRERLTKNLRLRSQFIDKCRQFLFNEDFIEIETPYLTKATPEGARDFVVPSRFYPSSFFALPQSPQQYKQLLMVAGIERYFQIARAFRDEDLRADRGYEHTQIDLEMSFVNQEEIIAINERMITSVLESLGYTIKKKPFPRFPYGRAVKKFGTLKFDPREVGDAEKGVLALAWVTDFPFFEKDSEGNWTFTHNPFSAPQEGQEELVIKGERIERINTQQYDLICNGFEIGGGSIRSHQPEILKGVFKIMGYTDEQIEREFGHMLEAFEYGVPPHGGIAYGVERIIMTLTGEESIREVQAFPQTSTGHTAVMDAPSPLEKKQLDELGIEIKKKK